MSKKRFKGSRFRALSIKIPNEEEKPVERNKNLFKRGFNTIFGGNKDTTKVDAEPIHNTSTLLNTRSNSGTLNGEEELFLDQNTNDLFAMNNTNHNNKDNSERVQYDEIAEETMTMSQRSSIMFDDKDHMMRGVGPARLNVQKLTAIKKEFKNCLKSMELTKLRCMRLMEELDSTLNPRKRTKVRQRSKSEFSTDQRALIGGIGLFDMNNNKQDSYPKKKVRSKSACDHNKFNNRRKKKTSICWNDESSTNATLVTIPTSNNSLDSPSSPSPGYERKQKSILKTGKKSDDNNQIINIPDKSLCILPIELSGKKRKPEDADSLSPKTALQQHSIPKNNYKASPNKNSLQPTDHIDHESVIQGRASFDKQINLRNTLNGVGALKHAEPTRKNTLTNLTKGIKQSLSFTKKQDTSPVPKVSLGPVKTSMSTSNSDAPTSTSIKNKAITTRSGNIGIPQLSHLIDVVMMMKEGRLVRVIGDDGDETSRIIDMHGERSHISFTMPPGKFLFLPCNAKRVSWDLFIALLLAYYALTLPLLFGFDDIKQPKLLETIFTFMFMVDMCIQFLTAYEVDSGTNKGWLETRHSYIAKRYLMSWFVIDIVSTVPWSLFITVQEINFIRLGRVLRLMRLGRIIHRVTTYWRTHPSIVRLCKYITLLLLILHWMACVYWYVSCINEHDDEWSMLYTTQYDDDEDVDIWLRYGLALTWAIWVSTGTGFAGQAVTPLQTYFTILCTLLGYLMYAFIIGSASSALNDLDTQESWKRKRLQQMSDFLHQRNVCKKFSKEIIAYYEYLWARNLEADDNLELFHGLHTSLKRSLKFAINQPLILKVPMFRDITEPCLEALINCLVPRIYLPGEWVLMRGERGEEMYFIARGKFEIIPDLKKPAVCELLDGQSFGEMALLTNKRRNSSVRSVCHGELMCLHIIDFRGLLEEFPIFAISLEKWAPHVRLSKGWNKIRHAVRLCRCLRLVGLYQSFVSMMTDINSIGIKINKQNNPDRTSLSSKAKKFRKFCSQSSNKSINFNSGHERESLHGVLNPSIVSAKNFKVN